MLWLEQSPLIAFHPSVFYLNGADWYGIDHLNYDMFFLSLNIPIFSIYGLFKNNDSSDFNKQNLLKLF